MVYLPVVVATSVPQSMIAWLLLAMGIGQVIGNAQAGRAVDRYGPRRTLTVGLAGALVGLALPGVAIHAAWAVFVVLAVTGLFGSAILVPQQHRLFGIAHDAPTVALGLNGSAIYLGAGLGSIIGATVPDSHGGAWLPLASTLIAGLALALALGKTKSPTALPVPARPDPRAARPRVAPPRQSARRQGRDGSSPAGPRIASTTPATWPVRRR
ncbi:MFS transporter [Nocardia niwae]|uniref:MFS transporter n=1 Tax=Nocardia niwae TaxID=626084 RepID=UPI0007A55DCD|nr:MFS transporter [Nocardia niwae]